MPLIKSASHKCHKLQINSLKAKLYIGESFLSLGSIGHKFFKLLNF
jgi:hypothetical protein